VTNLDETLRVPRLRVAAVLVRDGAVLLVRHVKGERTYWLLPGGGVDYGESLGEAVLREVKEETGLDVRLGRLILVNDSIPPDRHRHVVNLYFTVELAGGAALTLGEDWNLAELRWMPLDELRGLEFYPDVREELLAAIEAGYPDAARYLGNLWK
jgi:ADP-ribose pyrophosphatase YjhB (NUDIX family)